MQQHFFSRAALVAVVILTISAPAVLAEDEVPSSPSGSLEARIGRPPGATDDSSATPVLPGVNPDDESTGYAARETRMNRRTERQPPSFWAELVSWLQEQALRARD
jgi:hypothetical protein